MLRRLSLLTTLWIVLLSLLSAGTAFAQQDSDDEVVEDIASYGDTELIETLRSFDLLDQWIQASPVSPQVAVLAVRGNATYQAQRQAFLDALEAWAARTELIRSDLARADNAQTSTDSIRSSVQQVWDALLLDDRLATESDTLVAMQDALDRMAALELAENTDLLSEDSLTQAEVRLIDVLERAEDEVTALNGIAPALTANGTGAFIGFGDLQAALTEVDALLTRARELLRPASEESERLVSAALDQIPRLHATRMLASTEVGGLSVVTVDAYVRAAARSSCSIDWALLAGIGQIESNHGRIGGASVSRSGQVSTTILGPLLDGGATERQLDAEAVQLEEAARSALVDAIDVVRSAFEKSLLARLRSFPETDLGNGFAVIVDTDNGRLDGNDQWDRAVGPMQFIPETWSNWATDGNGDGVADPHNLYDAAASAGRFLCNLRATRGSSPSTFLLGYNSSTSYVRSVLSAAQSLSASSLPNL